MVGTKQTELAIAVPEARLTLAVTEFRPAAPIASIVIWPAMGVAARHYARFAEALTTAGFAVLVVDLPGQGASLPRASRAPGIGYHGLAAWCFPAITAVARDRSPGAALAHLGHSLGGQVMLLAEAREADADALVLVASGTPHARAFGGVRGLGVRLWAGVMRAVTAMAGYWPGHRMGFGGRQSKALVRDWSHTVLTGAFAPAHADVDYEQALRGVTVPVLAVTVEGDDLAPPRAVAALCAKAPHARVDWRHFDPPEAVDHIRWTRQGQALAPVVAEWLTAILAGTGPGPSG
ncbi:alpha/beta hydrolase family protein [Actinokineospora sp. 24-640]